MQSNQSLQPRKEGRVKIRKLKLERSEWDQGPQKVKLCRVTASECGKRASSMMKDEMKTKLAFTSRRLASPRRVFHVESGG